MIRPLRSLLATTLFGVAAAASAATTTAADPGRTRAYIDHAWSTLTRATDDCASLVDPKVATTPVLYLPADVPMPAALTATQQRCAVDVRRLPAVVTALGQIDARTLPAQGLLYLPHPYVVPGGMFNEMYGWDSYFIVLGLVADHREDLARGMVENFLYEIDHYGGVLNANRSYYFSRSQPPFLTAMMRAVLDDPASFADADAAARWLRAAYPLAVKDHAIWTSAAHRAGDTGLARYMDLGTGPVLEHRNADYLKGVIRYLEHHPAKNRGYLVKAGEHPDAAEAARLKISSCDLAASRVCADAWADGYRLSADYYAGDRAMRESGFDTNFHFGPYGAATHHYAAVGLNSLLYRYERDLHDFALLLGKPDEAAQWAKQADARKAAINKYLWRADRGLFMDYDTTTGTPADDPYLTTFYPLWAGLATPDQARAVRDHLALFERKGGLAMSTDASGAQWDEPFGWAPTNWLAVKGLDDYGFHADARRLATKFRGTVDRSLAADGTIREKYNMASGNADVTITAGYTDNVIGFGWTNGVYLKLGELLSAPAPAATDAGGRTETAPH
ncbi:trehalase family glycosidase [Dyella sp.]|jgi:alpha,alpha-trehalase|uniref:trehalase family glycosidase n=1 Tax=Dyella sp. TaxID=1869338 RepID=UPI002D78B86F|nr:trehalase family glycosidase [Dyella sp.]HET6431926.1 trehalase family glycosidase [Dyella sp.]